MQFLRDVHPTLLSALEGIVDQVNAHHTHIKLTLVLTSHTLITLTSHTLITLTSHTHSSTSHHPHITLTHQPHIILTCSSTSHHIDILAPSLLLEVVCFRENWSEEVLHLLMETLKECYAVVFQKRSDGRLL